MRLSRFLRRLYWAHRVRAAQAEIAHLEHLRRNLGPHLDRALRESNQARLELWLLDTNRPPITRAPGVGPRDGVVRKIREAA